MMADEYEHTLNLDKPDTIVKLYSICLVACRLTSTSAQASPAAEQRPGQ